MSSRSTKSCLLCLAVACTPFWLRHFICFFISKSLPGKPSGPNNTQTSPLLRQQRLVNYGLLVFQVIMSKHVDNASTTACFTQGEAAAPYHGLSFTPLAGCGACACEAHSRRRLSWPSRSGVGASDGGAHGLSRLPGVPQDSSTADFRWHVVAGRPDMSVC